MNSSSGWDDETKDRIESTVAGIPGFIPGNPSLTIKFTEIPRV
jgi:hypothetical protein